MKNKCGSLEPNRPRGQGWYNLSRQFPDLLLSWDCHPATPFEAGTVGASSRTKAVGGAG